VHCTPPHLSDLSLTRSLQAVSGWPPEADLGEWKGTADVNFNTFNGSSTVTTHTVAWPSDLSFHTVRATLNAESDGKTVKINYYKVPLAFMIVPYLVC
jgi:hypothetical protein